MLRCAFAILLWVSVHVACSIDAVLAFTSHRSLAGVPRQRHRSIVSTKTSWYATKNNISESSPRSEVPAAPAPVLNGKRVLPYKVFITGLRGHAVPAVYSIYNNKHQRGGESWDTTEYVGSTKNLSSTLQRHMDQHGAATVAHVRALSFTFPEPNTMQDVAAQWRSEARKAGVNVPMPGTNNWSSDALDLIYKEDDDDFDNDDDEFDMATISSPVPEASRDGEAVVSPFENAEARSQVSVTPPENENIYEFSAANVDKVLDEVRPYLIADGGNVVVDHVDEKARTVYLKLEGACGSCASSTVTMQMGIERVLKENFPDLHEVLQVEKESSAQPTELTLEAVQKEIDRLKFAIIAMGGVIELVGIDAEFGIVRVRYRGPNKPKQGLELALRDIPFVNAVEFVSGD